MNFEKKNNIIVIGDLFLDQYYSGSAKRISPEAPVPVINVKDVKAVLGGAANVANNIAALGGNVSVSGIVGNDIAGTKIIELLKQNNVSYNLLQQSNNIHTITKSRVISGNQQIVRLDCNDNERPLQNDIKLLIEHLTYDIKNYDIVVLSDYAKGICTKYLCQEVIRSAHIYKKVVIVDPKGNEWDKYKGADFITPNLKELNDYLHKAINNIDEEIEKEQITIFEELKIPNLIITRSEKGMTLIDKYHKCHHFPATAKDVYDVSGAGDTSVAVLSLYINEDNSINDVIELANIAAGIAVGKAGTSTIGRQELISAYYKKSRNLFSKKCFNINELKVLVDLWREKGESVVFTNGCFDIIHKGHILTLFSAAGLGNHLIVAINSDHSVKRLKGDRKSVV